MSLSLQAWMVTYPNHRHLLRFLAFQVELVFYIGTSKCLVWTKSRYLYNNMREREIRSFGWPPFIGLHRFNSLQRALNSTRRSRTIREGL